MRKFFMLSILMALPLFLSACNDDKKVEKGTPAQEAFSKETMKGLDDLKNLDPSKAKTGPR